MIEEKNLKEINEVQTANLWLRKDLDMVNTIQVEWQEDRQKSVVTWNFNFGEGGVVGVNRVTKNATTQVEESLIFDVVGSGLKIKLEYSDTNPNSKLSAASLQLYRDQLMARESELVGLGVSMNPIKAMIAKLEQMIESRSPKIEDR